MGLKFHSIHWIEIKFKLAGENTNTDELTIPLLVGQQEQEYPIIGFNVIEEILKKHCEEPQVVSNTIIQGSFTSVSRTKVGALVNLIQTRALDAGTAVVKVGKKDVMVLKGETTKVKC